VLLENIHIEWAEAKTDAVTPSIAVQPGDHEFVPMGLTSFLDERTRDVFGLGTVLEVQSEYVETFELEITAQRRAERRAMLAGLQSALSPTEQRFGVVFALPAYYGQTARFTPKGGRLGHEMSEALNRRKAWLRVELRVNVVRLVHYAPMIPIVRAVVDVDPLDGSRVALDEGS
jgi:hypothetical protein